MRTRQAGKVRQPEAEPRTEGVVARRSAVTHRIRSSSRRMVPAGRARAARARPSGARAAWLPVARAPVARIRPAPARAAWARVRYVEGALDGRAAEVRRSPAAH